MYEAYLYVLRMNTWRDQAVIDAIKFDIHVDIRPARKFNMKLFFFYNTPYKQDCLNCINRAYLIHVARLTNGFARLRDDHARLREVCE